MKLSLRNLAAAAAAVTALHPAAAVSAPAEPRPYVPKFFMPAPAKRAPALQPADLDAALGRQAFKSAVVAKAGPADPVPADLGESDEVVLSPEVRALAQTLGGNPVRIHNWVRNNVEFVPSYGAMQSAPATLQLRRGNAFDIASLAIALLRASGIPARYAYGTIEVAAGPAGNWIGGATSATAAAALFAQGGVPVTTVASGGQVTALRIEHAWVEAYVDFHPSRGAVQRASTTWVPMDPAYKQNTLGAGLAGATLGGFDATTLAAAVRQGATIDADGATALNAAALSSGWTAFRDQAQAGITATLQNATVGGVLGARSITPEEHPILMGALPYRTVAVLERRAEVADEMRWKVRYGLYDSELSRAGGTAMVAVERSVASLAGRKLTLGFVPTNAAEKQVLDGLLLASPFPTALPGYQFRMKAQLRLDGTQTGEAGDHLMGTKLVGGAAWFDPRTRVWVNTPSHDVVVGETHAVAIAAHGVATATLTASRDRAAAAAAKLAAGDFATLSHDDVTGEALHFAAYAFAGTVEGNARVLRDASGVLGFALPSLFRASTTAAVTLVNGAPQSVRFPGVSLETMVLPNTAVARDGTASRAAGFQRLLGSRASAFGHLVVERLFADAGHPGTGASGVRALARANEAGLKLFTVTAGNAAAILPQLAIDAGSKTVVDEAARTGRRVAVPAGEVSIPAWLGAGYGIDEPDTGTTEYEIAGRYTGAVHTSGGLLPLALAGHAMAAGNGGAIAAHGAAPLAATPDIAASVAALNADYRAIPWASWAGAPSVLSAWWLAAIDDGASPLLGPALGSIVDGLVASQVTTLTGVPLPNNPPRIDSTPVASAAVGQPYQYLVSASDPDGDALAFSLAAAPAGVSISSLGLVSWAAPAQGAYEVIVRVSDGKATADQRYILTVGETLPLQLSVGATPQFVAAGDTVTITLGATGGRGPVTRTLTVDGNPVAVNALGQAQVTATGAGAHRIVATATDGTDTLTRETFFAVGDPADTTAPTAQIATPATDSEVTSAVDIVGTATDANLAEWTLRIAPHGTAVFTTLGRSSTAVTNGLLGRLDPSLLANGIYDVRLDVVDANGRTATDQSTYEVTENLKVGHFTVSFLDLSVEAAGIPVQVTRTYDTRRKGESLDFGHGWTVDYQNVRLQKNVATGLGWAVVNQGLQLCLRPTGKRKVNVTLPDGRVERFEARQRTECMLAQVPPPDIEFVAIGKTTATLVATEMPGLIVQGGNLYDDSTFEPWNPRKFRLTTLERFVYELDESFGIRKVTDPNGNSVTYGPGGIVHSAGSSVTFHRDLLGRIDEITDPMGRKIRYAYDAAGDLAAMTDRESAQTRMRYDRAHTLVSYIDPRGVELVRNEYDANGRLVAQYDAAGKRIDLAARDLALNREVVKNRRDFTTAYEYDSQGNVTRIVDARNKETLLTYDARGNEATTRDPLGNLTQRTFDGTDNPLTEIDPEGNTTTYAWKPRSRDLEKITDARNNFTEMTYSLTGNVSSIKDGEGKVTSLGYDGAGNLTSLKDGAGHESTFVYDAKGRRTREADAAGGVTEYEYDDNGNARTVRRTRTVNGTPQVLTTTREFDGDGNPTAEVDPLGNVSRTAYNTLKKVASQADALGRVTAYEYDARGHETKVTHADGLFEAKTWDPNGNEATVTDRAGRVTTNTYDELDRLAKVTYADGRFVENTYDDAGRLTAVKDERGKVTAHEYDRAGRRTKTTDPELGSTGFQYDGNGNLERVTDPRGAVTVHEYDKANRRTKTTYPITPPDTVARFETWEYDGAGRRTAWTDTGGYRTTYAYDGAGRLKSVTQPSPDGTQPAPVTTYGYDEVGNKVSQTDALLRVTRWEYDALGRVTKRILPGLQEESFTYDAVGNVATHVTFNGETIAYAYDALNRLVTKTLPGGNAVSYTYTATGQVETVTDVRGPTRHTYDLRDRLVKVEHPEGWVVEYGYDEAGNRTSVATRWPGEAARVTSYTHDGAGRIVSVTGPAGEVTTFGYDAAGNRTSAVLPNGITTIWTYDARNRLTRVEHKTTATGAVQAFYESTWNAQGLRATQRYSQSAGQGCLATYTYDRIGRLKQATTNHSPNCPTTGNYVYTYDAVGNRLTEYNSLNSTGVSTYVYDANDRLTAITGASPFNTKARTFAYDAAGNVIRQTVPTGSTTPPEAVTDYRWDAEGRLVGVTTADYREIAYTYDAEGQLVGERVGSEPTAANVTRYLADKNLAWSQILEERDGAGALKAAYQFADTMLLKQERGTQALWSHGDHLSTRLLTDSAGTILNRYVYSPFGEMQSQSGTAENVHLFAGERYDANLGHTYLRARWMNPVLGRFAGMDPHPGNQRQPSSLHDFIYAGGDPIGRTDPRGTFSMGDVMGGISGAMNIATNVISVYDFLFGSEDDSKVDGPASIWDYLMAGSIKGLVGSLATGAASSVVRGTGSPQKHHVIPVYVCGALNGETSSIPKSIHDDIHYQLERWVHATNVAGVAMNLLFKKPRNRSIKTPIQRLGLKIVGREAIAAGLFAFYAQHDYLDVGIPPMFVALAAETILFIKPKSKGGRNSAPFCQRP